MSGRALEELFRSVGVPGCELREAELERMTRVLAECLEGYRETPSAVLAEGLRPRASDEPAFLRDVPFVSLCRDHGMPFRGRVQVGYLPGDRTVDPSGIVRLVQVLARRLQTQDRLTDGIARALEAALEPRGVMVRIEAEHLCPGVTGTVASQAYLGEFRQPLWRERLERTG